MKERNQVYRLNCLHCKRFLFKFSKKDRFFLITPCSVCKRTNVIIKDNDTQIHILSKLRTEDWQEPNSFVDDSFIEKLKKEALELSL